jgi:hypothetical protein
VHLEGLTTVPNDPLKYGPWAGKILAGAENEGRIYSIAADGSSQYWELGINPEDIEIIPADQNFYGVNYGASQLMGAPASEFTGLVGDVLIAQESGPLWHVRWDTTTETFQRAILATVTQWEHVTFSTAGIVEIPPIGNKCPLSQGFWKNHPLLWPADNLTLGDEQYTKDQLLALLKTPVKGDASLILAYQLIAAKLNILMGSNYLPVESTITHADGLLSPLSGKLPYHVPSSSANGALMTSDAAVLDNYNNGGLTSECEGNQ